MVYAFTAVLVFVAVSLYVLSRLARRKRSESESAPADTKPMSVRVYGNGFRYLRKENVTNGDDFCKVFIDGPWKWKGQQRFAGVFEDVNELTGEKRSVKVSPGHFFAMTKECAASEIGHYYDQDELKKFSLMKVEIELDNMLDLTDYANVMTVANEMYIYGSIWAIIRELIVETTG
jgi:hypothetical protein